MPATINSVCTINGVIGNTLTLEVMPNNIGDGSLQFYYLNKDNNVLNYTSFNDFTNKFKESVKKNNTVVITFCGISNKDLSVPEYLYLAFSGNDIQFKGFLNNNNNIIIELKLKKSGQTIENNLSSLFTDNIGVFLQAYL